MRPDPAPPPSRPSEPRGQRRLGASDCERIRQDGGLAQPVNAVTSLAYVAAAAVLAVELVRSGTGTRAGMTYSGMLALVGVGSVLYHGPQPPGARRLHDLPIPAALLAAAASPLAERRAGSDPLPGRSRRRYVRLVALWTASGLAYAGGRTGAPTCDPDSRLQLHGLWHVLSAAALATLGHILFLPGEGC